MKSNTNRPATCGVILIATLSLIASASHADDEAATTQITAADISRVLADHRQPARQADLLAISVEKLRDLQADIRASERMTDAEKLKWNRTIDRRVRALEKIADRLENADADQSPDLTQSPIQSSPQQRNVPVGWRQARSWQGGGLLPGGSWQGAQSQELWGWTMQSNTETNMPQLSQSAAQNPQDSTTTPEFDKLKSSPPDWGFPMQWPQGFPTDLMQGGTAQGGGTSSGVMGGSRAASSSSRRGSSFSSQQRGSR